MGKKVSKKTFNLINIPKKGVDDVDDDSNIKETIKLQLNEFILRHTELSNEIIEA